MTIFLNTLPPPTETLIAKIKTLNFLKKFYLSGGTALSLQIGHRQSNDLDFFTKESFNPEKLQVELNQLGQLKNVEIEKNTLNLYIDGVKLQFLYYPYKLIEKKVIWNDINLSSVLDIACTKLITISSRGGKKDFIDLYVIINQIFSLKKIFTSLSKKYAKINYNKVHLLKSLLYFTDADLQPMPKMLIKLDWKTVKREIVKEVKKINL